VTSAPMQKIFSGLKGYKLSALMFVFIFILSACVGPQPLKQSALNQLGNAEAIDVFTAGFDSITSRYLNPVSLETIAVEGARGLASINPNLAITTTSEQVALNQNGFTIARIEKPGPNDVRGWALVVAKIADAARIKSGDVMMADQEQIYEAVFDGALSQLDIFSRYAGAKQARGNRAKRDGFGGIGIRYKLRYGKIFISEVIKDTPADKAKLTAGDEIKRINSRPTLGWKRKDISAALRGRATTFVNLGIRRAKSPTLMQFKLQRAHIVFPTVTSLMRDHLLILRISSFNQNTARSMQKQLEQALNQSSTDVRGIVIDLRGNPGGLLKQSIRAADLLLTQGTIISTRGRHPDSLHTYEAGGRDLVGGIPIVVLVDSRTASAAEILAAALQDRGRAVVVGTASFGKGTVQTVIRLPNDGEITLTWSRFKAPTGYYLHGLGIRPVICTSGRKNATDNVIKDQLAEKYDTRASLVRWRHPGLHSKTTNRILRRTCPAEERLGNDDVKTASQLLKNQALFQQALEITDTNDQALKPQSTH